MSFDFAIKALVAFYEFHFLFLGMVDGANSIDIHVVSSLRGGVFLILDSKHFVESTAIVFVEGVLFFLFSV
jgi:hypothetical protein